MNDMNEFLPGNEGERDVVGVAVGPLLGVEENAIGQQTLELDLHSEFVGGLRLLQFDERLAVEGRRLRRIHLFFYAHKKIIIQFNQFHFFLYFYLFLKIDFIHI